MKWLAFHLCFCVLPVLADDFLLVIGEPGEANYEAAFEEAAQTWERHFSAQEGFRFTLIGRGNSGGDDRNRLEAYLSASDPNSRDPLWILLHGHGSFDTRVAAFNLRGPDVTLDDFREWLKPLARRSVVLINGSASSSPFLTELKGPNRIIITATQTTGEENYSYFGQYFAKTMESPEADLDGDGCLSLLEAFLHASRSVDAHYATMDRMVTEHAILDDNSDGKGTPADFFKGMHAVKRPKTAKQVDGARAKSLLLSMVPEELGLTPKQRARRMDLEETIGELRRTRKELGDDAYYEKLEAVALELSDIYHQSSEPENEE